MAYKYTERNLFQKILPWIFTPAALSHYVDNAVEGVRTGDWNIFDEASAEDFTSKLIDDLSAQGVDFSNLTQSQIESILEPYWESDKRLFKTVREFDVDRFESDYAGMLSALENRPESPDTAAYWSDAKARADAEAQVYLDELEALKQDRIASFNDQLRTIASGYNTARSGILSQQYQQNSQLMNTLSSQMDRSQRNALEAGASAGLRLAGNINTLLSVQNKQSQTSLETANQLAQMMVNQRNAEASVRGQYGDYMDSNFAARRDVKDSAFNKAQSYYDREYGVAKDAYAEQDQAWDDANAKNPLWEYRNTFTKSKYNNTGG